MSPTRPTIPAQRRGSDPYSGRAAPLHTTAARLIRDAIAHYPGCRVAAAGLSYRDAARVHELIQTAHLTVTWPTEI